MKQEKKEYYARLNDIRTMPYRGELVLLFRESYYWYELEIFRVNTVHIDEWFNFCNNNKILYWCYLDKIENLMVRPIKRAKGEWYTPELPLFENNFHFPNCFTLTKPNRKEKK